MTRTIRIASATALAAWLAAAGSPALAASDAVPVDPATAEAAARGAVCPAAQIQAEQLEMQQHEAIQRIGELIAAHAPPDSQIQVLNGRGYNYETMGSRPPQTPDSPPQH